MQGSNNDSFERFDGKKRLRRPGKHRRTKSEFIQTETSATSDDAVQRMRRIRRSL